jgi:hypothetical protein
MFVHRSGGPSLSAIFNRPSYQEEKCEALGTWSIYVSDLIRANRRTA